MSIVQFSPADFVLLGTSRQALGIKHKGVVLVLFHINGDTNCTTFIPVFNALVQQERRIGYAMADVFANNRQIIVWAKGTTTPMTAVPVLILYVDGRPRAKYKGQKDVASLRQFIVEAISQVTQAPSQAPKEHQTSFMPSPVAGGGMYGGPASAGGGYMPDAIGHAPNLRNIIRGGGGQGGTGMAEAEDEHELMMPDSVTPYNAPWGSFD